jgi:hypothetical protein
MKRWVFSWLDISVFTRDIAVTYSQMQEDLD